MRKFSFLFVVGLLAAALAVPAFAGDKSDCDFLKDKDNPYYPELKGLYGLCVAYQNADEDGREDIIRHWDDRVAELDIPAGDLPEMPNRDGDAEVACPCWTADDLDEWTAGLGGAFCYSTADYDRVVYNNNYRPDLYSGVQYRVAETTYECSAALVTGALISAPTTFEETEVCRAGLQVLQDSTWDHDGDPNTEEVPVFPPCFTE